MYKITPSWAYYRCYAFKFIKKNFWFIPSFILPIRLEKFEFFYGHILWKTVALQKNFDGRNGLLAFCNTKHWRAKNWAKEGAKKEDLKRILEKSWTSKKKKNPKKFYRNFFKTI